MSKITTSLATIIVIALLVFGGMSFVNLSANPTEWGFYGRVVGLGVFAIWIAFALDGDVDSAFDDE